MSLRRVVSAAVAASLALPASAHAHGLVQRADLPIPEWLFGWAAAVVLIVSFVALAVLWRRPQLEGPEAERWRALPGGRALGSPAFDTGCQVVGVLLLALVLVAGLFGENSPQANVSPTFVFVVFWVGLVFASLLFGNVFHALNPWRAIARVLRLGRAPRPYPERLGYWPAAVGLFAFAWLELAAVGGEEPRHIAIAAAVYSVLTLGAMAVYGVEPWLRRGEAFSVYFGLFSRVAPVHTRDGVVGLRRPLTGLPALTPATGIVGLLAVMIGTVTYDGLSGGAVWQDVEGWLGTGDTLSATLGMVACVAAVAGFFLLGARGAKTVGGGFGTERLARAFVHSLVPIAVVYVAAHYLTLLIFQGQATAYLASDPLGQGWDLFGTASIAIDYGVLSQNTTWYLQVAFVVCGHVAALALAHDRALVLYDDTRRATRSQYWMLGVMVGFTSLALWLLAQTGSAQTEDRRPAREERSPRLVDFSKRPPFVNSLDVEPGTGRFLLSTNRGFFKIDPDSGDVARVEGVVRGGGRSAPVGTFLAFLPAGGRRLLGSGHPDSRALPNFLGYMESGDGGRSWRVISRLGDADLHKLVLAHDRLYAWDAVLSAMVISKDGGRTFSEHFTPAGLVIDFVVDPEDPESLVAATEDTLYRSGDEGDQWRGLLEARGIRLAWPVRDALYRADADGKVYVSRNRGRSWEQISSVDGEPYKLKAVDERHLYMALSDGTILESFDQARTWDEAFRP